MLGLITCLFNPANSKRLKHNYFQFRKKLNHPIVTVELAFNDQKFFIDDSIQIRGTEKNIMWQKERLLNIALESLPNHVDKVAWLDADIIFENENWFQETEKKLDVHPVVQPFDYIYEKPSNSEPVNQGIGFGKYKSLNDLEAPWPQPWPKVGIAWAARREVLKNGFFDKHVLGSSDTYQLLSWLNAWDHEMIGRLNPYCRNEFLLWAWDGSQKTKGDIGYVQGNIEHLPHGKLSDRKYYERDQILVEHEFNPNKDIILDQNQIFTWTSDKILMHNKIKQYFIERNDSF
jgi:hypothetical protein